MGRCFSCFFFFFFKQKTAYEIYQCDWSSDVCSSDLKIAKIFFVDAWCNEVLGALASSEEPPLPEGISEEEEEEMMIEIGRASCRERV